MYFQGGHFHDPQKMDIRKEGAGRILYQNRIKIKTTYVMLYSPNRVEWMTFVSLTGAY